MLMCRADNPVLVHEFSWGLMYLASLFQQLDTRFERLLTMSRSERVLEGANGKEGFKVTKSARKMKSFLSTV